MTAPAMTRPVGARSASWLPEGTGVVLDPATRRRPGGVLVGGAPVRVVRLAAAGAALLDRLAAGEPVPRAAAAQRMVRRLLDAGLAHPRPRRAVVDPRRVTVVIPVRDDPEGLAATVATLGTGGPATVVVDDASAHPVRTMVGAGSGATVLGHVDPQGPAAARNAGWRAATTDLVAFVDAGCRLPEGWLDELVPYLDDPTVAAVAPRIVASGSPAAAPWLTAYESCRSALDLGPRPAPVRPRSWVPYVPTAALVVRRRALDSVGGFDERLRTGEDVDLVWRLHDAGWRVRYQPDVTVTHPVRATVAGWARQRFGYGRSAAPLARRHGDAVAPLDVSPWTGAVWALAGTGHPLVAAGVAAGTVAALVARTNRQQPAMTAELARLAVEGHVRSGEAVAAAVTRAWWPAATAAAVLSRRARWALGAAVVVPALADWIRRRPDLDPARWTALHLADDLSYGAGVWAGCWRERSITALVPRRPQREDQTTVKVTSTLPRVALL